MTFDEFLERGRINAKLTRYQKKKENALEICRQQLKEHQKPYAALSGGKDSVAMAYIVNEAANDVGRDFTLWSHISDASFPETKEIVQAVAESINRKIDIYKPDFSAFDLVSGKRKAAFGKTGVFFNSVREYAADKDLAFVGTRASESRRRMNAAKAHGMVFHSKSMGDIDVVNPLQWFNIYDVASALYEYDAPIHPIYKKFDINTDKKNGCGEPKFIRLGYITSKDLMEKGTAVFLKTNYPECYNNLKYYFPEIGNYC